LVYFLLQGTLKENMFDEIVNLVKQHIGNKPEVAANVPAGKEEAINHEIATQVTEGLSTQAATHGGVGGLLSKLQNTALSGSPVVNAIEGGLVSSLASKFGLPPAATGAIAASLPGLLQKIAHKANDPNDASITHDGLSNIFSKMGSGGLGNLFNR
jgi:uncharacterized protein YidB (DUF937 family)